MFSPRPGTRPHEYHAKCNLSRARNLHFLSSFSLVSFFLSFSLPRPLYTLPLSPLSLRHVVLFRVPFRKVIQKKNPLALRGISSRKYICTGLSFFFFFFCFVRFTSLFFSLDNSVLALVQTPRSTACFRICYGRSVRC